MILTAAKRAGPPLCIWSDEPTAQCTALAQDFFEQRGPSHVQRPCEILNIEVGAGTVDVAYCRTWYKTVPASRNGRRMTEVVPARRSLHGAVLLNTEFARCFTLKSPTLEYTLQKIDVMCKEFSLDHTEQFEIERKLLTSHRSAVSLRADGLSLSGMIERDCEIWPVDCGKL